MNPTIVALFVCKSSRAPLHALSRVEAVEQTGIQGDRHAKSGSHRQVLLVEAEVLERFGLAPGSVREQVTVRGLDLNALAAGTRLRVGDALLEVAGPCDPCERMNEVRPGLKSALVGQRGRFVRVLQAGAFSVGDALVVEPPVAMRLPGPGL